MVKRLFIFLCAAAALSAQAIAIRAGRLIDPESGQVTQNQVILVEDGRVLIIGPNLQVPIPSDAEVIDLTQYSVLPGLVDAHNHLALTYKRDPENNNYYLTSVLDSTAIRAIQAVSNGITMMSSGFTVVGDLGNAANYADSALRVAIEQGWIPGPTVINSESSSAAWAGSSRRFRSGPAWSIRNIWMPIRRMRSSKRCARTSCMAPR